MGAVRAPGRPCAASRSAAASLGKMVRGCDHIFPCEVCGREVGQGFDREWLDEYGESGSEDEYIGVSRPRLIRKHDHHPLWLAWYGHLCP